MYRKVVYIKIPAPLLHPYIEINKNDVLFDKAYVSFPKGTKINGVDIGNYICDVFISKRQKQQQIKGEFVKLGFMSNKPVSIYSKDFWKDIWADDISDSDKQFQVNPRDLVKAIKQQLSSDIIAELNARQAHIKELCSTLSYPASESTNWWVNTLNKFEYLPTTDVFERWYHDDYSKILDWDDGDMGNSLHECMIAVNASFENLRKKIDANPSYRWSPSVSSQTQGKKAVSLADAAKNATSASKEVNHPSASERFESRQEK